MFLLMSLLGCWVTDEELEVWFYGEGAGQYDFQIGPGEHYYLLHCILYFKIYVTVFLCHSERYNCKYKVK